MITLKTIFVTGGTGKQGGAVAKNLSDQGFIVKVLTRDPNSTRAQSLKNLNIQLVKGDLNNVNSYKQYLKDADGVFSVQTFENGIEKEMNQGMTLASISKEFGVKHFLYSSVLGAGLNSGAPHWENKIKIEDHIKQTGLPYTIIRPASLYENFLIPQVKKGILKGRLIQPVNRDTILQYMAVDDVGKASAKIFQNPENYFGKIIPLATEQLSTEEVAITFSEALNKQVEYRKLPPLIARLFLGKSVYKMFKWLDEKNRFLPEDINSTKKEFPNLLSLKSWIRNNFPVNS